MRELYDANGNVVTRFHGLPDDGLAVQRVQDIEPVVEQNKRLQSENFTSHGKTFERIASIPMVLVERWGQEDGINLLALPKKAFAEYVRKKLRDPDNRFIRTSTRRI